MKAVLYAEKEGTNLEPCIQQTTFQNKNALRKMRTDSDTSKRKSCQMEPARTEVKEVSEDGAKQRVVGGENRVELRQRHEGQKGVSPLPLQVPASSSGQTTWWGPCGTLWGNPWENVWLAG